VGHCAYFVLIKYILLMVNARFLHAADLHLGSPLQSLGDLVDPALYEKAKKLVNNVFQNLVDLAKSENVDFVILAGDIYDTADRDPGAQLRFFSGLSQLRNAGIKVFMAHGNHDPLSAEYLNGSQAPKGVHIFPAGEVSKEVVTMSNGAEVTVAGISYSTSSEPNNFVPLFKSVIGKTVVGVLHTNVGGNSQHGDYAPCSISDLENSIVNYWALGHIHDRQVHETSKGYWAYPGNLQGRSTKSTECGPKGVLIVEVDENGSIFQPKFVPCDNLRFRIHEINLSSVDKYEDVIPVIAENLTKLNSDSEDRMLLIQIEFVGTTTFFEKFNTKFEEVRTATFDSGNEMLSNGAVIKIKNCLRPAIDLVEERSRETLLAYLLRALDADSDEEMSDDIKIEVENIFVTKVGDIE